MDFGLAGKVVIVTGARANIGRAIALDFAGEGAKVVIVGRDAEAGARVVKLAQEKGAQAAMFVGAERVFNFTAFDKAIIFTGSNPPGISTNGTWLSEKYA